MSSEISIKDKIKRNSSMFVNFVKSAVTASPKVQNNFLDVSAKVAEIVLKIIRDANLIVDRVKINYGMGDLNPVDHVLFYLRDDDNIGGYLLKEQVSCFIPQIFEECYVRLYCKTADVNIINRLKELFNDWFKKK